MERLSKEPARDAYILLRIAFIALPVLAGVDKFFGLFVDWGKYLSFMFGIHGDLFLMCAGLVEILVGFGVYFKPRIFANVVGLWLALIIVNLLILGNFYDVALRDLGLCFSAFALGRLAKVYG